MVSLSIGVEYKSFKMNLKHNLTDKMYNIFVGVMYHILGCIEDF